MNLKSIFLILSLISSVSLAEENRSKVGIRPYPRDSAHEKTEGDRVANWKTGIGNYDDALKANDYTALNIDSVFEYDGAFKTKQRFFEFYIHQQKRIWEDPSPEKNSLIRIIQKIEQAGNSVGHIILAREGWLYDKDGDTGPIVGDPRILYPKDVENLRGLFKTANKQRYILKENYKLIQMILHPAVFMDNPEAQRIIKMMDGICYESHHFYFHWPLGKTITTLEGMESWPDQVKSIMKGSVMSDAKTVARGAKWVTDQGLDYIFYYGPYRYKDCDGYTDLLERTWLESFWDAGLPKHHPNMHYYLNAFPHGCGNTRPVGPESNPNSYLGFAKWLIQELEQGK
jgi:hypothetical protein